MTENFTFAESIVVEKIEDSYFYHCMDIPGIGEVGGDWDLRATVDQYLGEFNFSGKRVLDVGAASGFLTFEMEKRGADVVSFDMDTGFKWNLVPHWKLQDKMEEILSGRDQRYQRLKNGYWFAHRKIRSKAKVYYGDIYNLPEELGTFDVVFFGMILSHLRDPFQALYSASRLSTDTVIITNQTRKGEDPSAYFIPNGDDEKIVWAWWSFSDGCLQRMLEVLGFEVRYTIRHPHQCTVKGKEGYEECTAFVAQRIAASR